jgi:anaerobic dimethyl sulfoxide reductase subunit C (anchor subunit)
MDTREWALLVFTILGQTGAGLLFVLMVVRAYVAAKADFALADRLTERPLYLVVPIMAVAFLASLLHLGSPLNILRAVPNLGSSWLSREVVIAVLFVVFAGLYTFLRWRKAGSDGLRTAFGWIAAVFALAFIYAMSMVYMIVTQPAWNTIATPLTFLSGSLLLGALATATALIFENAGKESKALVHTILQGLAIAAIVLLGIQFLVLPIYLAYLSTQGVAALASLNMMIGSYGAALFLRLFMIFAGAGVLAAYLYRNASLADKEQTLAKLAYSAFVLVLAGEVLGRFIFYVTHYRIGI